MKADATGAPTSIGTRKLADGGLQRPDPPPCARHRVMWNDRRMPFDASSFPMPAASAVFVRCRRQRQLRTSTDSLTRRRLGQSRFVSDHFRRPGRKVRRVSCAHRSRTHLSARLYPTGTSTSTTWPGPTTTTSRTSVPRRGWETPSHDRWCRRVSGSARDRKLAGNLQPESRAAHRRQTLARASSTRNCPFSQPRTSSHQPVAPRGLYAGRAFDHGQRDRHHGLDDSVCVIRRAGNGAACRRPRP